MREELDLSQPFVRTSIEGGKTIIEFNLPNDSVGDMAFEWDLDGSERKKWDEYIKDLEEKGIRGQLAYRKVVMNYNPEFDQPSSSAFKLDSYKMLIFDLNETNTIKEGQQAPEKRHYTYKKGKFNLEELKSAIKEYFEGKGKRPK